MHADSWKVAVPLKDGIAALKGQVEDIGYSQPGERTGGFAYQESQLGFPAASMDTKAQTVVEEIRIEDSGWGTLHGGGELRPADQRWIRRRHDACRGG